MRLAALVNEVQRLPDGVLDILVVGGEGEKQVVERLYVALRLYVEGLVHVSATRDDGNLAVKDVYLLVGIANHRLGGENAAKAYDYASGHEHEADYHDQLYLVL